MSGRWSCWIVSALFLPNVLSVPCLAGAYEDGGRYYLEGAHERAVAALEEYLAAHPDSATAPCVAFGIGVVHEHDGRLTEAKDAYRRVMEAWPHSHAAREAARKLVSIYRKKQEQEAAAEAGVSRLVLLARYHPEHIDLRKAVQILEQSLEDYPKEASQKPGDTWLEKHNQKGQYPLLAEALQVVVGPDPEAGGNLLRNPGFELDGKYVPEEPPVGWQFEHEWGPHTKDNDGVIDTDFLAGHGRPRTGKFCAGKYTNWGLAHGWYVQSVRAIPGEKYDCAIYALTGPATGTQGQVRLGIDPAGDTDPRADTVIWTEYESTNGVYQRIALDGGRAMSPSADHITLFLELRQDTRAGHNVMLFDDASIVRTGAPEPPPQTALPPLPPPPTPTPLSPFAAEGESRMGYDPALLPGGLLLVNEPSVNKIEKKPEKFAEWKNETLPDICRKFRGCGMVAARVGLCWYNIEREQDVFDWRISDEIVSQLEEHGVVHVACVATSPVWALDPGAVAALRRQGVREGLIGCTQIRPECWDEYEEYMERLVLR
jgi:tetratricopeptide (TPR) repeat protein